MENSKKKDPKPEINKSKCKSCKNETTLNESGFCQECSAKIDRDYIRMRQWDYSTLAFGIAKAKREEFRDSIIETHGKELELLPPENKPGCLEK